MRARYLAGGLVAFAFGCGIVSGIDDLENVPAPTTARDGAPPTADAGAEAGAARCDPTKPFGAPEPVTLGAQPGEEDSDARLSADERTLYFQSNRGTADGYIHRVWVALRPERDGPFGAPTLVELDDGGSYYDPVLTPDGLTIVVQRGVEESRIQFATRPDPGARFLLPLQDVPGIDEAGDERDPFLLPDGRLLFTRLSADRQTGDLFVAAGSFTGGFAAAALTTVDTTGLERNAVLSGDGRELFLSSDRLGPTARQRIFSVRRSEPAAPFGEPELVAEVTVPGSEHRYDAPTWLSPDRCVLYFSSDRDTPVEAPIVHVFVAKRGK